MQTHFSAAQLEDPELHDSEKILRACVHCGFCLATCPTYAVLGDELDSPRGRIYLIKEMLESGKPASSKTALHIDRCLSCLSCMTTCPSGVHYMHLVDVARTRIEDTYRRPWFERMVRAALAFVLPRPAVFRSALRLSRFLRPFARFLPQKLRVLLALAPKRMPPASPENRPRAFPALGQRRMRAALLQGCVQTVLAPEINAATVRFLTRHGVEVVAPAAAGCCGALAMQLGRGRQAMDEARRNVAAWTRIVDGGGLDAIVVNASGCGTMVKDYGYLLRDDPDYAAAAARVSELAVDVAEMAQRTGLNDAKPPMALAVAYHSACSLQHGQGVHDLGRQLIRACGFEARDVPDGHLCCGSAGTYNLLQAELAEELGARKAAAIRRVRPDVVAAGNIGCIVQIARSLDCPVVHTVELLDWATGGPCPPAIAAHRA
jgi:glycolate dehydrogenase iron-sulfur subunit